MGNDAHALGYLGAARAKHTRGAFLAYDTNTAGCPRGKIGVVAKRGNLDVEHLCSGKDGRSVRYLYRFSVYLDIDHGVTP